MSDVFRRDLDRIEVPAEAIWVPAQRRRSPIRSILAIAGAGALVIAAVTGGLALRRDGDVAAPMRASASPGVPSAPGSVHPTANIAGWATGHVPTGTILTLLGRGGFDARLSPPAPAKALLFNSSDLELVAVDNSTVRGFVIYRYRDAAAASIAYQLPIVHDPNAGTISWVARPRFVLVGDALVNYGTDDDAVHDRIARALVYPDVATVPPATCAEERERTLVMTAIILRLDRASAKRTTVAELEAAGLRVGPREADPNTFVCVVAVAGELRQPMGLIAVPNYPWGVFVTGAGGEPIGTTAMDGRGSWPPFFDALADRVPEPYPATVTELIDTTTIRVKFDSAQLSQEFGLALVRADRYTELSPSARDIRALGLKAGDRVLVFFQRERRDAGSGAYLLSKLAVPSVVARTLGSSIGLVRLGAEASEIRSLLGPPATETVTHGQGGPEWQYPNGTIVRFAGPGGTVWQIVIRAESAGRTAENFGIGDPREAFAGAYREFRFSPGVPDDQVQVNSGGFGSGGRTLNVTFTSGRASMISLTSSLAR